MSDRMLVVSATHVMARGFLVIPTDRRSRAGEPVNGLFAVARAIQRAIAFKVPARAVAVLAAGEPPASWPALLREQRPRLPGLLAALGVATVEAADEARTVAAYTQAALEAGHDVVIVGADKRFAQLVSERVWWYDPNKDARYTPEMVQKRFLVPPARAAEWLALVGDDDALPGVAGIGQKGATGLVESYPSIEAALADAVAITGRTGKAVRAALAEIPRELARARLATEPALLELPAFTLPAAAAVNPILDQLGFVELLAADQTSGVRTAVCDTDDAIAGALAAIAGGPVTLHALFDDPAPVRTTLAGLALAADSGVYYFPGAPHPRVRAALEDPQLAKYGHDLTGLVVELRRQGLDLAGIAGDSAAASHLTQPSNWSPHDLPLVAKHVLGRSLPDEEALRGVGRARKPWAQLPVERVADFAGAQADAAAAIWRALAPGVAPALLAEYLALTQTLVRMELAGLAIDTDELARAEQDFAVIEAELQQAIEEHAGHPLNVNSSKQLGSVLFEELKLPIVSHTKTGWSTAVEALERIEHAHPIVPLVIRWRLLRRMRDSWIVGLRGAIDRDGRVHSRFHPARSFSGRLVNTHPDLGRVPGRTPEMKRIRRAFVASPGHVLLSVDYNQLGLHVLAHLTQDPALVEPLRDRADLHAMTAAAVLELPLDAITTRERQIGKVVNFATFAGQGPSALALQLGVSAAEAKAMIARFDLHYAGVRTFQDGQLQLARDRGYIETLAGRRWPIGNLESLDPHDRSYAERLARRATHEGSVSDVARRGLLDADVALRRAGLAAVPVLQILDEVLFEVPAGELPEAAALARDAMAGAFALAAPLRVGLKAGPTWADLEPLAESRTP